MKKTCKTHTCKWERKNAGTHHIKCCHPSLEKVMDNPVAELISVLATGGRGGGGIMVNNGILNIEGNASAIRNGYFIFPYNFDRIWLTNCDGFEEPDGDKND